MTTITENGIYISDKARDRIKHLMEEANHADDPSWFVRVGVVGGGGYKKITMHARKNALGFYEKMGYKTIGKEFHEITIPHYVMEKEL